MYKILVSDPISPEGLASLHEHSNFDVTTATDLTAAQ